MDDFDKLSPKDQKRFKKTILAGHSKAAKKIKGELNDPNKELTEAEKEEKRNKLAEIYKNL